MKDLFVNKSFDFINKYQNLDHYGEVKTKYGLEVMYYFITKTTIILLIAYLIGLLKEVILYNIFFIPLRSTSHGFHAKTNLECWIITAITYIFFILFIKYIEINYISIFTLSIISVISFILWSPADTKNLPLIRKNNRLKLKIISLLILITELFLSLLTKYRLFIIFSIIVSTLCINPIIYKMFGLKFNNYIDYQ